MTPPLPTTPSPTVLHGPAMWLARIVWLGLVTLGIGFAIVMAPAHIRSAAYHWQVQQSYDTLAGLLSLAQFATSFLFMNYGLALLYLGVALLIFARKSNDWLALLVALGLALMPLATNLVGFVDNEHALPLPWSAIWHRIYHIVRMLGEMSYLLTFFLFPRGRLSGLPPRWLQVICLGLMALLGIFMAAQGNSSWDLERLLRPLIGVDPFALVVLVLCFVIACGITAQITTYRTLSQAQQRQVKWVVLGLALAVLLNVVTWLVYVLFEPPPSGLQFVLSLLGAVTSAIVPLAFGIAILRHRLWDIDLAIRRALVYGALIGIIVAVYAVVVGGLGALVNQAGSPLAAAMATGLIAVLFNPLRAGLQRTVNRALYGYRDEPAALLGQLGQHLESAAAPEAALARIVETIARALKLPYVAIEGGASWGTRPSQPAGLNPFPLLYQGSVIGQLLAAPRAAGEMLSREDQRALQTMAHQIAPALRAARLTQELQHSRQNIVSAREEERRRIRRDLHDGLGPTLAAQTLKLDAAIDLIETHPQRASELLHQLKRQTQTVVADVRRLVYELRPPALDEVGLVDAIRNFGFSIADFRFEVVAPERLPSLPAAVEVAAYRIITEALTNVVKHARAKTCTVTLTLAETHLHLKIVDDGVGLPTDKPIGIGLHSMRERAEELGGQLVIESIQPHGTRVIAILPISNL